MASSRSNAFKIAAKPWLLLRANDVTPRVIVSAYSCIKVPKHKQFVSCGYAAQDGTKIFIEKILLGCISYQRGCVSTHKRHVAFLNKRNAQSHEPLADGNRGFRKTVEESCADCKANSMDSTRVSLKPLPEESIAFPDFWQWAFIGKSCFAESRNINVVTVKLCSHQGCASGWSVGVCIK